MLRGLPHDGYLFQCGVCFALEQVGRLPTDLNEKVKELDGRHTATTNGPTGDAGSAVFASTPFWDAYQRTARARQYGGAGVPLPGQ